MVLSTQLGKPASGSWQPYSSTSRGPLVDRRGKGTKLQLELYSFLYWYVHLMTGVEPYRDVGHHEIPACHGLQEERRPAAEGRTWSVQFRCCDCAANCVRTFTSLVISRLGSCCRLCGVGAKSKQSSLHVIGNGHTSGYLMISSAYKCTNAEPHYDDAPVHKVR